MINIPAYVCRLSTAFNLTKMKLPRFSTIVITKFKPCLRFVNCNMIKAVPKFACVHCLVQISKHSPNDDISEELRLPESNRFKNALLSIFGLYTCMKIILRIIYLSVVFLPVCMLYPLTYFSVKTKDFWYAALLFGFNLSGPIFLKLGQWASTRRDLFPEELCSHLSRLQRHTRPHSSLHTVRLMRQAYGPEWKKIFVKFANDGEPIGSGCCAQVYKAWINPKAVENFTYDYNMHQESNIFTYLNDVLEAVGLAGFFNNYFSQANMQSASPTSEDDNGLIPVAVKVLHPSIERTLRQDLSIMKGIARAVTWMCPSLHWLSLSDCVDDFTQMMDAQVDFCVEAKNLERFARNFVSNDAVVFPRPFWTLTRPYVLVETFEEGRPMQDYVEGMQQDTNLAELGINTIFKMVFEDNFVHGDLHPGNILVQERELNESIQKQSWRSPLQVRLRSPKLTKHRLVILDCGIVSSLDVRGEKALKAVFAAVTNNDGVRVAELFLEHSQHQCDDPISFKQEMSEIVTAALSNNVTLQTVQVAGLLNSLFETIMKHKVKLDGSFASVILAMMVLEGLGRSLDPTIDVVEKARPFLLSAM